MRKRLSDWEDPRWRVPPAVQRFRHYSTCSPDYSEKPAGEQARPIIRTDLGDGVVALTCGDCGAFVVVDADQ